MLTSSRTPKRKTSSGKLATGAALALALMIAHGVTLPRYAHAFDPQKVFNEEKPSIKKLFRFYLKKKKEGEDDEALDVLQYAADQGNQTARWKLGRMYEHGDSVQRDPAKAYHFYKQIADNYGEARPNTPEWAITGQAMVELGHFYRAGIPEAGVTPNQNEARVMFTTAAMYFRDPDGQFELGRMLVEEGRSAEEARQGIRMLELARQKGHVGALAMVGYELVQGEYVLQDVVRGLAMLTKAADRAPADMKPWIANLQQEAFALASIEQRQEALQLTSVE